MTLGYSCHANVFDPVYLVVVRRHATMFVEPCHLLTTLYDGVGCPETVLR